MEFDLKTWPVWFEMVRTGRKKFELRVNDRGFQPLDTLRLREWDPKSNQYTGREECRVIADVIDMAPLSECVALVFVDVELSTLRAELASLRGELAAAKEREEKAWSEFRDLSARAGRDYSELLARKVAAESIADARVKQNETQIRIHFDNTREWKDALDAATARAEAAEGRAAGLCRALCDTVKASGGVARDGLSDEFLILGVPAEMAARKKAQKAAEHTVAGLRRALEEARQFSRDAAYGASIHAADSAICDSARRAEDVCIAALTASSDEHERRIKAEALPELQLKHAELAVELFNAEARLEKAAEVIEACRVALEPICRNAEEAERLLNEGWVEKHQHIANKLQFGDVVNAKNASGLIAEWKAAQG